MKPTVKLQSIRSISPAAIVALCGVFAAGCAAGAPKAGPSHTYAPSGASPALAKASSGYHVRPAARPAARPAPAARRAPRSRHSAEAAPRAVDGASVGFAPRKRAARRSSADVAAPPSAPRGGAVARLETVRPSSPPPPVTPAPVPQARAKLLTAASVADHDRFSNYLSYLSRRANERRATGLQMHRRVRLRIVDAQGKPINDAAIAVSLSSQQLVYGRTHADGVWDFFPSFASPQVSGSASITVSAGTRRVTTQVTLPSRGSTAEVRVQLPNTRALAPRVLDLAFAIDVTGSMSDELRYVNREIADIVRRVKGAVANTKVRVGAVFYKDRQDHQRLQMLRFTTDVAGFGRAMRRITAGGGGDYPEDMNAGLQLAMKSLRWSTGNAVRVLVVLADAPPKHYQDARYRYQHAMADASRLGIRLLPVAASGANRKVEYLFRAMGAMTSTPYTYLTDDSGVGGRHMEADTDRVGVEKFNDLLTRLVISDLRGKGMHEPGKLGPQ
jgi:hypothetical protein